LACVIDVGNAARISKPYLSQREAGKRTDSTAVLSALAQARNVMVDDLVV